MKAEVWASSIRDVVRAGWLAARACSAGGFDFDPDYIDFRHDERFQQRAEN